MRPQIISFHCVVKNRLGQVLSTSFNQDVINQNDLKTNHLNGLVNGLQSVSVGEKRRISVPASQAYGSYDPMLSVEVRRSELEFGDRLQIGHQIFRPDPRSSENKIYRVVQANSETIVIDGNHPLAGNDLVFEVEIVSAREAQADDYVESSSQLIPGQLLH